MRDLEEIGKHLQTAIQTAYPQLVVAPARESQTQVKITQEMANEDSQVLESNA